MRPQSKLKNTQQWLQALLTGYGSFYQKLYFVEQKQKIKADTLIKNQNNLSAHSRLNIYVSGYQARLLECLRADYPQLTAFMTDELFNAFARDYINTHASKSYSLFDLGARFPDFLLSTKPANSENKLNVFDFSCDLAKYERAYLESTRAQGFEDETIEAPSNNDTLHNNLFEMPALKKPNCQRSLSLKFNLLDYIKQRPHCRGDSLPPIPKRETCYIGISRMNYRMHCIVLEPWQYHFINAIEHHTPVQQAARKAAEITQRPSGEIIADAMFFLPIAYENGLIKNA